MTRPSPPELFTEMARLSYALHWPLDTVLDLEHADRRRFLREVAVLGSSAGVAEELPA
jgi:hypothetical protein